jgi:hypothetical protein
MRTLIHDETVGLLLASMSQNREDGLRASFLFGKPGAPQWQRNMGIDLFYRPNKLTRAALYVRQNGPAYLKYLPIGDIWSMLQRFVVENFGLLANDVFLKQFAGSYAEVVSDNSKAAFAEALAISEIFRPKNDLTLFPLVAARVGSDFDSDPFFLIKPSSLDATRLPQQIEQKHIKSDSYPPLVDWTGRREVPGSWLGVRSPAVQASKKMKAAILGALALTPLPRHRYMFSGRAMFGGHCILGDTTTVSFGQQGHTPPLMYDILVTVDDHEWLAILAKKLLANERPVRRQVRALEYFYRAWESEPSERFPILCMALDGIFGDANHATQAVIDGIWRVIGPHLQYDRLRQLMDLRASVIHGGAPDVYDSRKYGRYYDDFEADPIHDMELVVAECLRLQIFGDGLKQHADPNAQIIAEAQKLGRLPKNLARKTILDEHAH